MFEGRLFTSGDDGLDPYVADLEARLALHFPEFFNGVAASRLVSRADQLTGRGLELADGYVPPAGTPLAVYFGRVVLDWPDGDFVLALPHFRRGRRTWTPSVDAGPCCRVPSPCPLNAALCNHTCHDATVCLRRPRCMAEGPLSCAVAYATDGMAPRSRLLWDYDGGARSGSRAFSVDLAGSLALRAGGVDSVPCACRGALPCPRGRWFRVFPDPPAPPPRVGLQARRGPVAPPDVRPPPGAPRERAADGARARRLGSLYAGALRSHHGLSEHGGLQPGGGRGEPAVEQSHADPDAQGLRAAAGLRRSARSRH